MNADAAIMSSCCSDHPYVAAPGNLVPVPPASPHFLPAIDQLESSSFLRSVHIGSTDNMEANVPALLDPASNVAAGYITSRYGHDHDILQFYPSASHYLAAGKPYNHFSWSTFLPTPQEYYFPTLLDENMASFGATPYEQLGLKSLNYGGYHTNYYLPPRGGYVYGQRPPRCQVDGCTADLSKARRYHRRHRVCEQHSKAPVVITAGTIMPQRFCQQCSRLVRVFIRPVDPSG